MKFNLKIISMSVYEYAENQYAIRHINIKILGIPIWNYIKKSTNNVAVRQLTVIKTSNNIKGFTK